ncbi:MAG: Ada metal-binding domain-containing protein [Nitriliruptoraceae bacterium]
MDHAPAPTAPTPVGASSTVSPAEHTGEALDLDDDPRLAALRARDPRFDGAFWFGVTTTGIYCRPSCPSRAPKARNVRFFAAAAAAQQAGFRACRRCRPDAVPGSPDWDSRADVTGRAMRLIADGVVDREGVTGLARRVGYSPRQLHRVLVADTGASPLALARVRRVHLARTLIESTDLPFGQVAFAAGFSSVRQFNAMVEESTASTPTALRVAAHRRGAGAPRPAGAPLDVHLRLAHRTPFARDAAFGDLGRHLVDAVEHLTADTHRRTLTLPYGPAVISLRPDGAVVHAHLRLTSPRDLTTAIRRCRRLLDLDADPVAIDESLADDPALRPLVRHTPGIRVMGGVDGFESAVRVVLSQRVSLGAARTVTQRFVEAHGLPLPGELRAGPEPAAEPGAVPPRLFPTAEQVAALDPADLVLPRHRAPTVHALASAIASGHLDLSDGADRAQTRARLLEIGGVGPWTVELVAMRALRDPDAFCATDLVLRRSAAACQIVDLATHSRRWRPWRSHAAAHLWNREGHP